MEMDHQLHISSLMYAKPLFQADGSLRRVNCVSSWLRTWMDCLAEHHQDKDKVVVWVETKRNHGLQTQHIMWLDVAFELALTTIRRGDRTILCPREHIIDLTSQPITQQCQHKRTRSATHYPHSTRRRKGEEEKEARTQVPSLFW